MNEICGKPMHRNCVCVRPPDHEEGECNCLYPNGAEVGPTQPWLKEEEEE